MLFCVTCTIDQLHPCRHIRFGFDWTLLDRTCHRIHAPGMARASHIQLELLLFQSKVLQDSKSHRHTFDPCAAVAIFDRQPSMPRSRVLTNDIRQPMILMEIFMNEAYWGAKAGKEAGYERTWRMRSGSQGRLLPSSFSPSGLVAARDEFSISTTGSSAVFALPCLRMASLNASARCSTYSSARTHHSRVASRECRTFCAFRGAGGDYKVEACALCREVP